MKFQQYTGPMMAKSMEDTAFYRYVALLSLNEVGGDPRRFGTTPAAFGYLNQDRLRHWPDAMLATSTHDTKRGEEGYVTSTSTGAWSLGALPFRSSRTISACVTRAANAGEPRMKSMRMP